MSQSQPASGHARVPPHEHSQKKNTHAPRAHVQRRRVSDLMTSSVPRMPVESIVADALMTFRHGYLEEASHIYLVDSDNRLHGQVPVEKIITMPHGTPLDHLKGEPPLTVRPDEIAERVALLAVERHDADVAVVDESQRLLGAIPIGKLLALLHEKHVDDFLRMGGLGRKHPGPHEKNIVLEIRARIPWLIVGLMGGTLAGWIVRLFEKSLEKDITLAFFLPLVVYMADAIGTQTETVLVRAMAHKHISAWHQLAREGALGLGMGVALGFFAWAALTLVGATPYIALVIGISLLITALEAVLAASIMPLLLARFGVDPALASGPLATVIQDLLSVATYLAIATLFQNSGVYF